MTKKLVTLLICAMFASNTIAAYTTKTVCHNVKNSKTKKVTTQCKTVKVHKKFNGTKVPTGTVTKKPTTKKK